MSRSMGRPGAGPRVLIRRARGVQLATVVVALTGVYAWVRGVLMPAVAVVGILVAWGVVSNAAGRIARARAGLEGEREVAGRLRGFGIVIYGWQPPGAGFDVDVIVVDPCVAAVEIKRASGRVRTRDDGTVFVDGRRLPGVPLRQAVRGAVALRRAVDLRSEVDAVLCVTGMRQRPRIATSNGVPVIVCSARHLRRVLRRLSHPAAREGARGLERLTAI